MASEEEASVSLATGLTAKEESALQVPSNQDVSRLLTATSLPSCPV